MTFLQDKPHTRDTLIRIFREDIFLAVKGVLKQRVDTVSFCSVQINCHLDIDKLALGTAQRYQIGDLAGVQYEMVSLLNFVIL